MALIGLLVRKVPLPDVMLLLRKIKPPYILWLTVLTVVQVSIGVFRWQRILVRLGERVSFWSLYSDVLVGLTYNMFLPTTVGGDVIRALRARSRVRVRCHAWSSSIFERITGLLAMALSAAMAMSIGLFTQQSIPIVLRYVIALCSIVLLIVFLFASAPFQWIVRFFERKLTTQNASLDEVRGIVFDLENPLAHWAVRVETLAWSMLYQIVGIAFVVVGAFSLGDFHHEVAIAIGVPLILILSMIPITIGGLGLREGLFVEILGRLGVSSNIAFGLATQWLASSFFFAILGSFVMLNMRRLSPPESTT